MAEKQWKCTVCGYLHNGKEPPDVCPVCGANKWQFILNQPLPAELEAVLKDGFAGESKAHVRNLAFAAKARAEGHPEVALLFTAVAQAERVHANQYLKYLEGVVGTTEENLRQAFENEMAAKQQHYPALIKAAYEAGREDVAWSLSRIRDVEGRHADLYKNALAALAGERRVTYHVCGVCGYVFDGPPPEHCPVCRTGRDQFKLIT